MFLAVIFLPLFSFLASCLFGRFLGKNGVSFVSIAAMLITTFISFLSFYFVALKGSFYYVNLGTWINSGLFVVNWGFMFDSLTVSMFLVVNIVSTLVHIYSTSYMSEDPHIVRFIGYLSFFTFFMLILVSADNFIQMFLGWEGVGLCSYLLISFWFTRVQANKAAIKAMLVNRVGDFGLSLGIIFLYDTFKSLDFSTVFVLVGNCSINNLYLELNISPVIWYFLPGFLKKSLMGPLVYLPVLDCICLLLFVGSVGKSAQIGLHTWLPDAMEGPTPVSALIHAATMVTAGVFLIIRCSPIFEFAPTSLLVVAFFGALTAFFAATAGLVQNDLKRVIAYSTCSQLGYMVFACGLSNYYASFFHLANHAFFKALLFLSAGSVIHGLANEQDMRRMGGLSKVLPFTYSMVLVGSLSLMGFPFLTGFYSKDFILEVAFSSTFSVSGAFSYWLGTISALFTAFYSFRLIYLVFLSRSNSYKVAVLVAHELPFTMAIPLIILCFGSVFLGYISKDMVIGMGTPFFNNAIFISPLNLTFRDTEFVSHFYKVLPVIFSLFGCSFALWLNFTFEKDIELSENSSVFLRKYKDLYVYMVHKWHFDTVYHGFITKNVLKLGYTVTFKYLDKGVIEFFGPYGLPKFIYSSIARFLSQASQTGYIYNQGCFLIFGFYLIVVSFFWLDCSNFFNFILVNL